jgi:hypothetical protein
MRLRGSIVYNKIRNIHCDAAPTLVAPVPARTTTPEMQLTVRLKPEFLHITNAVI